MWNRGLCNSQGGNRVVLRQQVQEAFRKNKDETDPEEIEKQKDAYVYLSCEICVVEFAI